MNPVGRQPPPAEDDLLPIVVVGGYDYAPGMNQISTLTVRELARTRTVLYIHSETGGSVLNVARGRARYLPPRRIARVAVGPTRIRRVQERLWIAPLRGPLAWFPLAYPEPMRRRSADRLARLIRGWLREHGHATCHLLFYWPEYPELLETVPHAASAYDCSEDAASMPGRLTPAGRIWNLEQRLITAVDRAWVVSPGLCEGREGLGTPVEVLPTAIDLRLVEQITAQPTLDVPQLRDHDGVVVGYSGGLSGRLDWDLLEALADHRPAWRFLFVGGNPAAAPPSLHQRQNVAFTGMVPYDVSLRTVARCDVGVIPVRTSTFSRGNSFMKLLDYLVAGIPVVAAEVPDTAIAAQQAPGAVTVATGIDQWLGALDAAVAADRDAVRAAGAPILAARTNEARVATIAAALHRDARRTA